MGKLRDETGNKFGLLTVIQKLPPQFHVIFYLCECVCGGRRLVSVHRLRRGSVISCGKKGAHQIIGNKKMCAKCNEIKDIDQFYDKYRKFRRGTCNKCIMARDSARPAYKKKRRGYWLGKYRITPTQYENMLKQQDNKCAICKTDKAGGRFDRWHVDHNHSCCGSDRGCIKCVRGLLCASCNHLLGNARDSISILQNAITYLSKNLTKTEDHLETSCVISDTLHPEIVQQETSP